METVFSSFLKDRAHCYRADIQCDKVCNNVSKGVFLILIIIVGVSILLKKKDYNLASWFFKRCSKPFVWCVLGRLKGYLEKNKTPSRAATDIKLFSVGLHLSTITKVCIWFYCSLQDTRLLPGDSERCVKVWNIVLHRFCRLLGN